MQRSDIETQATVRVDPANAPDGVATLVTSVAVSNVTATPLTLPVAAYYPVLIRLYSAALADSGRLVYDETTMPRSLVGQDFEVGAHASRTLDRPISVDVLHSAGVQPGRYTVVAVVTTSPPPTSIGPVDVQAGEIELP
jgi:hypothetical protein